METGHPFRHLGQKVKKTKNPIKEKSTKAQHKTKKANKDKKTKRDINIVIKGQFRTLAVFLLER